MTRVQWPPVAPPDDDSAAAAADKVAEQATALAEEHPPGPVDVVEPQGAPPLVRQLEMAPAADCSAAAAGHEMMIGNRQPSINNNNPTPSTLPPDAGFGGGAGPSPISSGKGSATSGMSAPRRGRGVLNNVGVGPGARIPVCASCSSQIRYDPSVHSGSNFFYYFLVFLNPRGKFVTAMGLTWCPNHFLCAMPQCRRELHDVGFVEEQKKLYCEACFETHLAPTCSRCSKRVKGVPKVTR